MAGREMSARSDRELVSLCLAGSVLATAAHNPITTALTGHWRSRAGATGLADALDPLISQVDAVWTAKTVDIAEAIMGSSGDYYLQFFACTRLIAEARATPALTFQAQLVCLMMCDRVPFASYLGKALEELLTAAWRVLLNEPEKFAVPAAIPAIDEACRAMEMPWRKIRLVITASGQAVGKTLPAEVVTILDKHSR